MHEIGVGPAALFAFFDGDGASTAIGIDVKFVEKIRKTSKFLYHLGDMRAVNKHDLVYLSIVIYSCLKEGINMAVTYKKLFKILIDRDMKKRVWPKRLRSALSQSAK